MYVFVLIAALFLVPVYHFRRRWQALAFLLLGLGFIHAVASMLGWMLTPDIDPSLLKPGIEAGPPGAMLPSMLFVYEALIVGIGVTLGVLPRARAAGACAACGYDLRGLSDSICPECGTRFDDVALAHEIDRQDKRQSPVDLASAKAPRRRR